jgi:predicted dehydrogenase
MAREIRVGLIGYKFMGKAHSNAYNAAPRFFELDAVPVMKAICGRDEAGVKAAAKKWGWESYETSYRKLVKRNDIDLVDVSTPNNSHYEITLAALRAGKAVACEKPLAMNSEQAHEMAVEARRRRLPNMVWFNYRRCPAVSLARQIIEEGRLGRIFHVRATYLQDWIIDPQFPLAWRLQKGVAGSGAHGDLNAHLIDLARFLVGEFQEVAGRAHTFIEKRPIEAAARHTEGGQGGGLSGKGSSKKGKVTVDDTVVFLAMLERGVVGTFEATRFAQGRKNYNRIEINGSDGSLAWSFERMNELEYFNAKDPKYVQGWRTIMATESIHPYVKAYWPPGHVLGYEHACVNQAADLMQGIAHRTALKPDFVDGLRCQEVLDAVMESSKSRRWVKVAHRKV